MLTSLAHADTNRKFTSENHSKVKQFDKEDILNRFKRADSSTTYVAVLVFLSVSTILKNFIAAVDKHLPRIFSFNLLCKIMKYCMFRLYNVFLGSTSTAELLLKANPVACLTRQSAFSATNN